MKPAWECGVSCEEPKSAALMNHVCGVVAMLRYVIMHLRTPERGTSHSHPKRGQKTTCCVTTIK